MDREKPEDFKSGEAGAALKTGANFRYGNVKNQGFEGASAHPPDTLSRPKRIMAQPCQNPHQKKWHQPESGTGFSGPKSSRN